MLERRETLYNEDEVIRYLRAYVTLATYQERMKHMKNPAQRRTLSEVVMEQFGDLQSQIPIECYKHGWEDDKGIGFNLNTFVDTCKRMVGKSKK